MSAVSFTSVLGDLSAEFGWAPDAWKKLTWRELQAWVVELGRRRREEADAHRDAERRQQVEQQKAAFFRSQGVR